MGMTQKKNRKEWDIMVKHLISITTLFLICSLPAKAVLGDTIHVPADQPTIQAGIDAASNGDLVLVAPGVYVENIDFLGKAISVSSEAGALSTIINGDGSDYVVSFESGETLASRLNGFMIINGSIGIQCYFASPTISNCLIAGNHGLGGICCTLSLATIFNCTIVGNISGAGGGIFSYLSALRISGCTIQANFGIAGGGGIFCITSFIDLSNCIIANNVGYSGGGIYCYDFAWLNINHCTIAQNYVAVGGEGGGLYCLDSSVGIRNSVFWANTVDFGKEIWIGGSKDPSELTMSYSDVEGGEELVYVGSGSTLHWMEGNIDQDPGFAGSLDFHLRSESPCIDAGTDAGIYTDIDGQTRPYGAGFDIGADEFMPGGGCLARIVPISNSPYALYLIPVLSLVFLFRWQFR